MESAFKLSPVRRLLAEVRIWEGVILGGGWRVRAWVDVVGCFLFGWMVTGVVDINSS